MDRSNVSGWGELEPRRGSGHPAKHPRHPITQVFKGASQAVEGIGEM